MSITHKKTSSPTKPTQKRTQATIFNAIEIRESLLHDAKIVGIPDGAAETIADKVTEKVHAWATARPAITSDDLNRRIAIESKRYSADLSYVYQNRGKII